MVTLSQSKPNWSRQPWPQVHPGVVRGARVAAGL